MNFCKFVTSKASGKNTVDIKSVYMMSSEFGVRYGKSMHKILIMGGGGGERLNKKGFGIST